MRPQYPEEVDLPKGDATVRLALRHDDPELLERLQALPLARSSAPPARAALSTRRCRRCGAPPHPWRPV